MLPYDAVTEYVAGPVGRLAVVDHGGPGPDVLLLHGANRNLMDWEALRPHLGGLRLVAMDLRGHGLSDKLPTNDYGFDGLLADVDAVRDRFGLTSPIIVGHSLGGAIAVRCAATKRASGIVDLDGFSPGPPRLYTGISEVEVTRRRAIQMAMYETAAGPDRMDEAAAKAVLQQAAAMSQAFGWNASVVEAGARRSLRPDGHGGYWRCPPPGAIRALIAPLEGWDMFEELAALSVPALVLQAGRMPPVQHLPHEQRELTEALVAGINRELAPYRNEGAVQAIRLEAAGHMLHFDAPAEVATYIRVFVESSTAQ